jgi:hypothetical protein
MAKPRAAEKPDVEDVEDLLGTCVDGTDTIQLFRYDPTIGGWSYVDRYDPAAFRALGIRQTVRERYGGGRFRARVRHPNMTWGQTRTFSVDGAYKEPSPAVGASTSPTVVAPTSAASMAERVLMPVVLTMAGAIGTYAAKRLLDQPPTDPLALTLAKQLAGAGSAMDPLELQRAISEAEARGEARGRELGKLQQQVAAPRESSGKSLGPSVVEAIDRNVPKLVDLFTRKMDLDAQALRGPQTESPTQPEPAQVSADPLVAMLESVPPIARKFLLSAAESGEQAEVYAGLVLSKLDDVTYANMAGFLERADFVDVFVATYPAFADHRQWVMSLAAAMQDSLAEAVGDDDDEPEATVAEEAGD